MKNIVACFKSDDTIVGYCEEMYGAKYFEKEIKDKSIDINTIKPIKISSTINNEPKDGFIDEILDTMPIGVALKLNGCVEGMDGQQLIYVGKQKSDIVPIMYYYFYDGKAASGEYPEHFGYAEIQLRYKDVVATWDENDEEVVKKLRNDYSFLSAVCGML